MENSLDECSRSSKNDIVVSDRIIGTFRIRNHDYLVVELKAVAATSSNSPSNGCSTSLQAIQVSQFKVDRQNFAIVEVHHTKSSAKFNLADLLTNRELEIIKLIAQGYVNKQIARKLQISEWTVSTHIRRVLVFCKIGVDSRAAMVYKCAFWL